jgi:3-methyladenine DNA glycosylase/8-oxoguanine DNA glycosylase
MKKKFSAHAPFNFRGVVESHGWADLAPFSIEGPDEALVYVAHLNEDRVVELKLSGVEGGVIVETERLSPDLENRIEIMVRWMLGTEQNFREFYELAKGHPKLAHACKEGKGRFLRSPTLFEDTVKTILTTNTSWSGTIRMVESLVKHYGMPMPTDLERHAFPSPARLAELEESELTETARLGYRTPYILELARDVASGRRDLEALRHTELSSAEIKQQLRTIKGVGEYSAASLSMLLGRYDFIPIDSWAFKLVSHEWHGGEPVGQEQVEAAFESWGRWKGLAYWFWDWDYLKKS